MSKIAYKDLTKWLLSIGMLREHLQADGKTAKRPTEQGNNIGISTDVRMGQHGTYTVVLYNLEAQTFIIDNLEAVIALKYAK